MDFPATFLGFPLRQELGNLWTAKTADDRITVLVYRIADDKSIPPLVWKVLFCVKGVGAEEVTGDDLEAIEDYLRKWIANFKEAARSVSTVWPD